MDLNLLLEAESRGILPADMQGLLNEARSRGLVPPVGATDAQAAPQPRQTNMVEQTMSGVNEGVGSLMGAPVDITTSILNAMVRPRIQSEMTYDETGSPKVNVTGIDSSPTIQNPVGGSQWFNENVLAPTISDVPPQNMGQRFGRRIGQEAGQTIIPSLGLLGRAARGASAVDDMARAAQANPRAYAATEIAGTVGAGAGGAAANEVAPNSVLADLIGQAIGGGTAAGGVLSMNPKPRAPSLDDLKTRQSAAYGTVDQSPTRLTPQATRALQDNISRRAASDDMDPLLAPKATRVAERLSGLDQPTIAEVEKARRLVGRDVAGANDATERAIGVGMKEEISDYLDSLTPQDVSGGDPSSTVDALHEGRDMTRRIKKSQDITNRLYKAENRAATSGTGGNEVNAIRQNIRQILDDPKKRRGYTPEEIAAMESIVRGTPTQNALRMIGRFSPTAGALPAMAGVSSGAVFGPMGAIPSALGYLAKGGAEMLTKRDVGHLDEMIRNAGPVAARKLTQAQKSALSILLAAQIANGGVSAGLQ